MENILEIKVNSGWIEVDEWIFRSWTGERRKNNEEYNGPVYMLGSDEIFKG